MNSDDLSLFMCYSIYSYTLRDEHGPIRAALTDVTFVKKKKWPYYKQIRLTLSFLNQGTKLVSKCRHKAKYKLRNHQPDETAFNANRLITVT